MGGAENFGRIDGRLRMGFQPFDPRQLLVYGLLNDLFMAPLEVRTLQRMPLERVLCQGLRQRGASVIVSYTLTNGVQFADELGWCDDRLRAGGMREAFLRVTQRVPAGSQPVTELLGNSVQKTTAVGKEPQRGTASSGESRSFQEPANRSPADSLLPYDGTLQSLRQAFQSLDRFLTGGPEAAEPRQQVAVVIPRAQTLFANPGSEQWHYLVSWLQKWSAPDFPNVSVLLFETDDLNQVPPELRDQRRGGVQLLHVGLPQNDEVHAFVRQEAGDVIDTTKTDELKERLQVVRLLAGRSMREIGWIIQRALLQPAQEKQDTGKCSKLTLMAIQNVLQVRAVWDDLLQPQALQKLEAFVKQRVCGQDTAVGAILARLRATGGRLQQSRKEGVPTRLPAGVFFLAGPTGVGKTEVFRTLCEHWKDVPARHISMSEYELDHQVTRLLGSPPSYVGDPRGELGQFLLDHPASILLFDEFEKANPRVLNVFLTLLEGNWTLGDGTRLDLSQCLIFFTSNAGAEQLARLAGEARKGVTVTRQQRLQAVREGLKRTAGGNSLPDELIGRLMSRIIVFDGLTKEMARLIIEPRLAEISRRLRELHGVQFEYKSGLSDVVQQLLSTDGGLGARDLTGRLTILEEDALALQWVAEGTGSRTLQLRVIDGELQVVTV